MTRRSPLRASLLSATLAVLSAVAAPVAMAQGDDASLARGARPDSTPEQRYQSAIREAGGGLKVALQECRAGEASARKACDAEARKRYKEDMAEAQAMRRNPDARPVNVTGEPIRSKETTTVIRP
ncbi:hypothetical protein M5C99_12155 [Acidovorax sp. NCPPB 2350]|nr:hypothetical protein M5C99_12155 [Acidovorax sp. NCPPB 2350]